MPEKLKSEIHKIIIDDATYKGTGTVIEPTYINYFFGNNGTGKSTIAKAIASGKGITFAPGKTAEDYQFLVYNQDYIDCNVMGYFGLPGIFTINEMNVAVLEQLESISKKLDGAEKIRSAAISEKNKKSVAKENLLKQLYQDCWSATESLRTEFDKTQDKKRRSKQFTEAVQAHAPVEHNLDELRRMYNAAYSDDSKRYGLFSVISNPKALDSVDGADILSVAIVNSSNTAFAEFLRKIGSSEWMQQGHSLYHEKADGCCPYCSRKLPDDFEDVLSASFDTVYQDSKAKLDAFLNAYRSKANELFVPLSKTPEELYPCIQIKPYTDKLAVLKAVISDNIEKINSKVAEPEKIIELEDTAPLFQELSEIITNFNKLIKANNDIVDAGPRKRNECVNLVFEHLAFILKNTINAYTKADADLAREISAQEAIADAQVPVMNELKTQINNLSSSTAETKTAMTAINNMLLDSGFQGFEIKPKPSFIITVDGEEKRIDTDENPLSYAVIRTGTDEIATQLSEGEKNFIAFMYFMQQVHGSERSDGDTRTKVVVIDDPVSSMDSSALFIVSAQIRKMIEICRNNVDNRNPVVAGNHVKQIFILTHNAYFHKEVTYAYANRWDFVSFYLVRKNDNKSSVTLYERINPDCPTQMMNVNPVKNSYAALWEEYKEVTSCVPLMNVIRRILEYYFLQLCGYQGGDLRKRILEDNKDKLTQDNSGNKNYTKFDMASAMLSYIAASSGGVNDGINYVDDFIDIQQCKDTFRMIFHYMGQDQHYDMMMGNK